MLIAILDFDTTADDRETALAQLRSEAPTVHAMAGNRRYSVHTDGSTTITVLHEWEDRASFDAYLASEVFARSGEIVRPLMASTPISRRFEANLLESV